MKEKIYKLLNIISIIIFITLFILSPIYMGGYKNLNINDYIKFFSIINIIWILKYFLKPYKLDNKILYYFLFVFSYIFPLLWFNKIEFLNEHKQHFILMLLTFGTSLEAASLFKNKKDFFYKIIILSSVIISIISMSYIFFPNFYNYFDIYSRYGDYYVTSVYRLYGTFNYPNILGLFSLIGIFLSLKYYKNNFIYKIIIYLNTLCLFLTMSKTIILFFILSFILLSFIDRDIKKIFLSLLLPIIFNLKLYSNMVLNNNFLTLFIGMLLLILVYLLTYKYYKKYLTSGIVFLVFIMGCVFYSKPLIVNKNNNNKIFISEFTNLKEKNNKLDIIIKGNNLNGYLYLNKHLIKNSTMSHRIIEKIDLANKISIKFNADEDSQFYSLSIDNKGDKLLIDKVIMNGTKINLDYYLFPYNYIKQFEQIEYDVGSVSSRFDIYKLSLKIIKDNPIFGHGFDYFKIASAKTDNLSRVLVEHSHIMTVGVENGIFSIMFWIMLLFMIIINAIRSFSKENVYSILVIFLLIYSSLYDFTMSFNFFLLLLFIFSMLHLNNNERNVLCICSEGGHLSAMKKIISNLNEKDIILITEKNKTHKVDNYVLQGSRRNIIKYIFIIPINFILNILYFIHYNPKVIITTGAHTGVLMCYLGRIFRRKVIFIEVYDRFRKLTLSGSLSYLVATDFIVQHKELQKKYKKSKYIGGLY